MNKKAMNKSHRERIMKRVKEDWAIVGKDAIDEANRLYKELAKVAKEAFDVYFPKEAKDVLVKYKLAYENRDIIFPKVYVGREIISNVNIPEGIYAPHDYCWNKNWKGFLEENKQYYDKIVEAATAYLNQKKIMDDKKEDYECVYGSLIYDAKYFEDIINVIEVAKEVYQDVLRETCTAISVISPEVYDAVRNFEKLKEKETNV